MNTRKEKLDFLKGLVNGKRNLKELEPVKRVMLDMGIWKEIDTGKELTSEETRIYLESQKGNQDYIEEVYY